jgi:hypothetical protein
MEKVERVLKLIKLKSEWGRKSKRYSAYMCPE